MRAASRDEADIRNCSELFASFSGGQSKLAPTEPTPAMRDGLPFTVYHALGKHDYRHVSGAYVLLPDYVARG